jgi:glucokinase
MKAILAARRVLVLAFGAHKSAAVEAMLAGPRGAACPASLLQGHPCVVAVLDAEAAARAGNLEASKTGAPRSSIRGGPTDPGSGQTGCALGIDVGGTKIAAGLLGMPHGCVLARRLVPTDSARGGRAVLDSVLSLARELASDAAQTARRIDAIGVGVCELVDRNGAPASANCVDWIGLPVVEELSAIAPAVIEADVRAAALAEARIGAGKGFGCFLFVTVGTGISCCLMLDGKPFLGSRGATGTMASSPISLPCTGCGHVSRHTLEELASGPGLVSRFNALHGGARSARDVLAAAEAGHPVALEVVRTAAGALGSRIGLLVNTLDPEAVVIGGGLGLSEGRFWDDLVPAVRAHVYSDLQRDLPIRRAETGVDAGWIGAAMKAWQPQPEARPS